MYSGQASDKPRITEVSSEVFRTSEPSVHATGQVGWWNGKTEKAGKWRKAHMWELQQAPA